MQNISAPTTEALSIKKLYESAGALENTFVFKIPVYENMPASPCPMPTSSTNVVLQVPSGYDAAAIYVDGVAYTPQVRNNRRIVTLPDGMHRQQWSIVIMPTVRLSACMSGPWNTVTMPMWRRNSRS